MGVNTEIVSAHRNLRCLTHIGLASPFGNLGNSVEPDQMPQNTASDQGLHYLLIGIYIQNKMKMKKYTRHPLNWKWTCPIDKDERVHLA